MRVLPMILASLVVGWTLCSGLPAQDAKPPSANAPAVMAAGREYSGMYSFRKEGEFVQLTIEDGAQVSGFISRYGDGESDKGAFLDQFFKTGKLDGNKLTFTTQTVHGTWFVFEGTVERGAGKAPGDEDYFALKGVLRENTTDADKKTSTKTQDVLLKRFPADLSSHSAPQDQN